MLANQGGFVVGVQGQFAQSDAVAQRDHVVGVNGGRCDTLNRWQLPKLSARLRPPPSRWPRHFRRRGASWDLPQTLLWQRLPPVIPAAEMIDPKTLPARGSETLKAMASAREEGPRAIARLATLALWHVGQTARSAYPGPEDLLPLDYLLAILDLAQRADDHPLPMSSSTDWRKSYPRPALWPPEPSEVTEEEATERMSAVQGEAARGPNELNRYHLLCRGLADLAEQGISKHYLKPLIDQVAHRPPTSEYQLGEACQALIRVGEIERALAILKSTPPDDNFRPTTRSAEVLVKIGRPDEAVALLRRLCRGLSISPERGRRSGPGESGSRQPLLRSQPAGEHDSLPRLMTWFGERYRAIRRGVVSATDAELTRRYQRERIASIFAYAGHPETARGLVEAASIGDRLSVELMICWRSYLMGSRVDASPLLRLFDRSWRISPAKSRAVRQVLILKVLLEMEEYESAWHTTTAIRKTLLKIPLWGKFEHRTNNLAVALWPVAEEHADTVYAIASDLLIQTAKKRGSADGIWIVVHAVTGMVSLIHRWTGEDGLREIKDFARSLQAD